MRTYLKAFLALVMLAAGGAALADPVNVNTADARTLAANLNGVGPAKAAAIVAYREAHGPFKTVDELENVKGVSRSLIDKNLSLILLGNEARAEASER